MINLNYLQSVRGKKPAIFMIDVIKILHILDPPLLADAVLHEAEPVSMLPGALSAWKSKFCNHSCVFEESGCKFYLCFLMCLLQNDANNPRDILKRKYEGEVGKTLK